MIFRFSEVTLKSEIVEAEFFFIVDDKLVAAGGKRFERGGRLVELSNRSRDRDFVLGDQLSGIRGERFGVLQHGFRVGQKRLDFRQQETKPLKDVAGLPFCSAKHAAQAFDGGVEVAHQACQRWLVRSLAGRRRAQAIANSSLRQRGG